MKYHNYYIYITTNPAKTVLYTGVTNDLDRRMEEHLEDHNGERKTFAGRYFCYNLIYYEYYPHIEWAIAREKQIKGMSRKKKEGLIAKFNPEWRFLNDPVEMEKEICQYGLWEKSRGMHRESSSSCRIHAACVPLVCRVIQSVAKNLRAQPEALNVKNEGYALRFFGLWPLNDTTRERHASNSTKDQIIHKSKHYTKKISTLHTL